MNTAPVNVDAERTGQLHQPAVSPKVVEAQGKIRLEMTKVIVGGTLVALLLASYLLLVYMGKEASPILAIIAGGVGYLLGGRASGN